MTEAMTRFAGVALVPREEVRFGVVLNGGVSLAVWMGGAVVELDRLIKSGDARSERADHSYRLLLALAGAVARTDVIAGTSAGGINGAALGLAQVNQRAEVSSLRDLWVEHGQIEALLRQPFRGAPTSLMKGDDYFLPRLHDALAALATPLDDLRGPREAPLDLTVTTTVLNGNQLVTSDSLGQQLPQELHAARFHWRRWVGTAKDEDRFSRARLRDTAAELALAARATASFPVAFEPTWIPVLPREAFDDRPASEKRVRPRMEEVVESWGDPRDDKDRSRFAVDGGLLANTPTRPVLDAIGAMPADGPVRRVVLLVYPHAPEPGLDPADAETEPPTLVGTIGGLLGALTAQGSRTFVEEVQAHNRAAAGRRGTRGDILESVSGSAAELPALSATLFPHYRHLRVMRAARDLARRRVEAEAGLDLRHRVHTPWDYERVRTAARLAQQSLGDALPYVPDAAPGHAPDPAFDDETAWRWGVSGAASVAEAAGDLLRRLVAVLREEGDYEVASIARKRVTRLTSRIAEAREGTDHRWNTDPLLLGLAPSEDYWRFRLGCYALRMCDRDLLDLTALGRAIARQESALLATGRDAERQARLEQVERALALEASAAHAERGVAGVGVRALVDRVLKALLPALTVLAHTVEAATADEGRLFAVGKLRAWAEVLLDGGGVPDRALLLDRLLQLEIATTALGDEVAGGSPLPVELVQLSAQTANPTTRHTRTSDDKLGGMSVNRFGGFLKRSWRVNDWTWGRMDAATILCLTVLQPARVRRVALLSGYVAGAETRASVMDRARATVDGVVDELFGTGAAPDLRDLRATALDELADAFATGDVPPGNLASSMPALAGIFAWALHLELVPAEMPALVAAIEADEVDGSNTRSRGRFFLTENRTLLGEVCQAVARGGPGAVDPRDRMLTLAAFDRAGIGREPMEGELSSDLIIRTSTTAAAVGATVLDSPRSGLGALRPVTRALRGSMLVVHWGVAGLTSRGVIARSLALLGLALGAVLVTLAAFGAVPAGLAAPAALVGVSLLLLAFGYGALRSGTMLHGLVLLTPLVPLLAEAVARYRSGSGGDAGYGVTVVASVVLLALGLMLLGTLPATTRSVFSALDLLADRQGIVMRPGVDDERAVRVAKAVTRRVLGVGSSLLDLGWRLLGVALPALLAVWVAGAGWAVVVGALRAHEVWLVLGAVACVLAGSAAAQWGGARLRVFALDRSGSPQVWSARLLSHPGGVQATWSVLYGAAYLALAVYLVLDPLAWQAGLWAQALCATALVLGVLLTLVVPLAAPAIALRRVASAEVVRAVEVPAFAATRSDLGLDDDGDDPTPGQSYAADLASREASFRAWVRPVDGSGIDLTKAGDRLLRRVDLVRPAVSDPQEDDRAEVGAGR